MAKSTTTKKAGSNSRPSSSDTVVKAHLHSVEGFAKRYGEAVRDEGYSPQTMYAHINEDNTELMFNGRLFPVLKIDKVRLVIWDGKAN